MNGRLEKNTAAGQEVILHLTYESISRGEHSIKAYCLRNGVQDWEKYIFFWSGYVSTQLSKKKLYELFFELIKNDLYTNEVLIEPVKQMRN